MTLELHPSMHAARNPDRPAIVMAASGQVVTYGELERASNVAAHAFRAHGLRPGDVVALHCHASPSFLPLCWGAQRAGLYYVPVAGQSTDAEIDHIVADSGARLVVTDAGDTRASDIWVRMQQAGVRVWSVDRPLPIGYPFETIADASAVGPIADETCGSEMFYTSGTTGRPKGVRPKLTGGPITTVRTAFEHYPRFGWGPKTVQFSAGPLYHASPFHAALVTHTFGGTVVVPGRFDAETALGTIERYRVTHSNWVPTHLVRLLRLPAKVRARYDLGSLQLVIHGAAPCPVDVKRRLIEWLGPIVAEYYGGSEGIGSTFVTTPEWLAHPGTVGRPRSGEVHIVDPDDGAELPVGQDGLVCFGGAPDVTYNGDAGGPRAAGDWPTYGDIGRLDDDGYLYLTDRLTDLIISGGVNIAPREIEDVLLDHPQVLDAAVFGLPDAEYGEQVVAAVLPAPGAQGDLVDQLRLLCRDRLVAVKVPRVVVTVDELPRRENGKLYKRLLREQFLEPSTHPARRDLP